MTTQPLALPGTAPPETLRLTVPVWGFDCSTSRIAFGCLAPTGPDSPPEIAWGHFALDPLDKGPRRMAAAMAACEDAFGKLARAECGPAGYAVVEQPFGQGDARPHPQSYYIVAAVQIALVRVLGMEGIVDTIEPTTWKKIAMGEGHGFASKPAIQEWARGHGWGGTVEDEADALGVAVAAGVRWQDGYPLR